MISTFDALVIGAGVIGLSVAFELARRGRSVQVIDSRMSWEGRSSTVAAGMLGPASEAEIADPAVLELQLDSLRRYPEFAAELEAASGQPCGYRTDGTLWPARHRDDELQLEHLRQVQRDRGLEAEWLTAAEARKLEPALAPRVIGGLLVPGDHQVDPRRLLAALQRTAQSARCSLHWETRIRRYDEIADGFHVWYEGASIMNFRARNIIIATGAWTDQLKQPALPPIGMRPVKGQLLRLRGEPLAARVLRTPDVYIVPRADGELVIGATEEEQGWDDRPTAGGALDQLRYAWEVLPGIYDLELREINVGFRPAVGDHMPVIGRSGHERIIYATGHYRHGILLAPATAWHVANLIEGGDAPDLLRPFAPQRLAAAGAAGGEAAK